MAINTYIPATLAVKPNATAGDAEKWINANSTWVTDVINKHHQWLQDANVELYQQAYDGQFDEIECREKSRGDGTENKLIANFIKIIVDTLVDYLTGKSPIYTIEDPYQADADAEERDIITEYRKKLMALLDEKSLSVLGELLRQGCIAGYSAIIAWVDEEGNIGFDEYPVQEVIPVFDVRKRLRLVIRKYDIEVYENGQAETRKRLEIYDDRYISYYVSDAEGSYKLDANEVPTGNPIEHKAGRIPVVIYTNSTPANYDDRIKSYGKGDLDYGVFSDVVAYCHGISDKANLVEYLQDMYLLLTGVDVDENEVLKMRKARAIALKSSDSSASFIAQSQADEAVEHYLDRIRDTIYDTTNTPQLSQLNGATATEIKMKYASMDIKANSKEPRLQAAIKRLLDILTDFLNAQKLTKSGVTDTYDSVVHADEAPDTSELYQTDWVTVSIVRNLPQNYEEIANMVTTLDGVVPRSYLYELLWFIDDPQKALEEMAAQEEAGADRELAALGYDSMFDELTEPKEPPDDDTEITE